MLAAFAVFWGFAMVAQALSDIADAINRMTKAIEEEIE
jgi:hypothetical protein